MQGIQRPTPNVYVNTQFTDPPFARGCNYAFVKTTEGIVMIDTPMLPTAAVQWRDELARHGEIRYIINTEYHVDHISGNYFFPGTIVSHEGIREMFTASIDKIIPYELAQVALARGMDLRKYILWRYEELDPTGLKLAPNYHPRPPTVTFNSYLTLHVGKHTFELRHLPGHTAYQVGVYVPEEKFFFSGDNFANKVQPSLAQCYPLEWLESLKKMEAFDFNFIMPGHGEVGNKADLKDFKKFIEWAIASVRKLIKQGVSKEKATKRISFEKKLPARHAGAAQQAMNVTRLYEMLTAKKK